MGSAILSEDLLSLSEPRDAAGGDATLSTGGAALWAKDEQDGIPFYYCFIKRKANLVVLFFYYWRLVEEIGWCCFFIFCSKR